MWLYGGYEISCIDDMPKGTVGFIYEVHHKPTGIRYIGKKQIYSTRKRKFGKKEISKITDKRKKLYEMVTKESDWKTYYGSQKEIKELVKSNSSEDFERTILCFVSSKKLLTYFETKELFKREVLESSGKYLNDNILGKFYTKDFQ